MINVNQITAQMARMSDPALQQYAAMHKSDPYTLSLALSESNRRKEMRQGAQMQQQPQPKVVDQEVAQMGAQMPPPQGMPQQGMQPHQLPEDSGIGQLPAPNMQRMAAGGIVAFDEGGEVPGYAGGGSPNAGLLDFIKTLGLSASEFVNAPTNQQAAIREMFNASNAATSEPAPAAPSAGAAATPKTSVLGALKNTGIKALAPLNAVYSGLFGTSPEELEILKQADAKRALQAPKAPGAYDAGVGLDVMSGFPEGAPAPAAPPPPSAPAPGALRPGGGQGINPAAGGQGLPSIMKPLIPELAPEIKALSTRLPTAGQAQGVAAQFLDEDKYAQQLKDFTNEEAAAIDERRTKLEKSLKDMPERYKDYEGRLKAQEKEDAGDKEKLTGMSFLEAGLAVLSGESPHAFVNLGRAKEGVKTYNEGIKDIKKSARERDKAFGDIENARQAQAEGKIDTMNRFEDSAAKSMSDSKRFAMSGLQSLGMKGAEMSANAWNSMTNNAYANQRSVADAASKMQTTDIAGQYGLASAQMHANATIGAAKIRAETDREYSNAIRQGQLDVKTAGLINSDLEKWAKTNHYTQDDPEYQNKRRDLIRQYSAANPGMAQSGGAPGGGGAPSDFVYKDGKLVPRN
jgi:hypothetical protein